MRDYDSPYRNATYLMTGGRRVGYLSLSDSLIVGPELDAGVDIAAQVVAIEAEGTGEQTSLTLTLEERTLT